MSEQCGHDEGADVSGEYGAPSRGDVTATSQVLDSTAARRSRASVLIPGGSSLQNRWKGRVLIAISCGIDTRAAIEEATYAEQEANPTFRPQYDVALLDLA